MIHTASSGGESLDMLSRRTARRSRHRGGLQGLSSAPKRCRGFPWPRLRRSQVLGFLIRESYLSLTKLHVFSRGGIPFGRQRFPNERHVAKSISTRSFHCQISSLPPITAALGTRKVALPE